MLGDYLTCRAEQVHDLGWETVGWSRCESVHIRSLLSGATAHWGVTPAASLSYPMLALRVAGVCAASAQSQGRLPGSPAFQVAAMPGAAS
jgi:hypothetical protein